MPSTFPTAYHCLIDTTTLSVKLILEVEQKLKHLQTAYYLSQQEPSLDDVWRIVDGQR